MGERGRDEEVASSKKKHELKTRMQKSIPYLWPKRLENHMGCTYLFSPYKGVPRGAYMSMGLPLVAFRAARAPLVKIMMAQAKRIYIFVKVNKLIFFFASRYFLKEIENMFYLFLSSYRNTRESLAELVKAERSLGLICIWNSEVVRALHFFKIISRF